MPRTHCPAGFVAPMLPTLVDAAPEGAEWLHEIKFDGYRTAVTLQGRDVHVFTRNGHDWTEKYAAVVANVRALRCRSATLDGEICVQDAAGLTDFSALRRAIRSGSKALVFFAFDLLALDGEDLRDRPLRERRARLQDLVGRDPASRIHFSQEHAGEGPAFFRAAEAHGLEGIVSKQADSLYSSGRTRSWVKVKSFTVSDYAVLGIERSRTGLPIALLASRDREPAYVGDAVVVLAPHERDAFWARIESLGTPRARLAGALSRRKASWVKEGLVARVRHLRGEDKLRHATIEAVGTEGELPEHVGETRHPRG